MKGVCLLCERFANGSDDLQNPVPIEAMAAKLEG